MVTYEPQIIYQFADRLYKKASELIFKYSLIGFGVGIGIAGFIGFINAVLIPGIDQQKNSTGQGNGMGGFIVVFVIAASTAIGYVIGKEKAFALKLQAQTALVMVRIEENTRARTDPVATPAASGPAE